MADFIYPKVMVLCSDSQGDPDFHLCTPKVTHEQMISGEHYELAKEGAKAEGYEGPMVAFDKTDRAARRLAEVAAWLGTGNERDNSQQFDWTNELFALLAKCPPEEQQRCADALEVVLGVAQRVAQTETERTVCDMLSDFVCNNLGDEVEEIEPARETGR